MVSVLSYRLLIFWVVALGAHAALAQIRFVHSDKPPAGFEHILPKQYIRVAVTCRQQHFGMYYAHINHNTLQFAKPEYLLNHLDGIKDRKYLLHLLAQPLALNTECLVDDLNKLPGYYQALQTKPVYLIYNPNTEAVYLFLNQSLFKKPQLENTLEYMSPSTSKWSYLNKMGAASSFNNDQHRFNFLYPLTPNYYNIYSNNVVAYKNSSFIANISDNQGIIDGHQFQMQNLYLQHFHRDKIFKQAIYPI